MRVGNDFVRKTIFIGLFCMLYGIISILIGMYVVPGTPDQKVYMATGILLEVFAIWFMHDQLS